MDCFSDEEIELFERYISSQISTAEKNAIKRRITSDQALRKKFLLYNFIVKQINEEGLVDKTLKQRFIKLDAKNKRRRRFSYIGIAASVAVIVAIFLIVVTTQQDNKIDVSQFKVEEPGLPIVMGVHEYERWTNVMQLYKQGMYVEALDILKLKPRTDTSLYFAGLFEELNGNNETARDFYQQLQGVHESSIFKQKALYRLALLFWENGQKAASKSILEDLVSNDNHIYINQAQDALRSLK